MWAYLQVLAAGGEEVVRAGGEEGPHLGCVMVEDDRIEVPAVVVFDEVLCGVGCLQAPSPNTFMLQQSLVQGKQHLAEEREGHQGCAHRQASTHGTLGLQV